MVETKIMKVFYDANCLPYKDKERQVHFPVAGNSFSGASGTTEIRFYVDQIGDLDLTWVANAKLPNGKTGSKVLSTSGNDDDGAYVSLFLTQWFTQLKGDLYISLQGYQGGINYTYDDETDLYNISGTPIIQATGVIKINIAFSSPFNGVAELSGEDYQSLLALLGTKIGMRSRSEFVEELPEVGEQDVFYVIHNNEQYQYLYNIYIWNGNNNEYIWVGDNTLELKNYYTKEQGEIFEGEINERIESIESGSPKGTFDTLSELEEEYPNGDSGIYLVLEDGKWYYWNSYETSWVAGGMYLSTGDAVPTSRTIAGIDLTQDITEENLNNHLYFSKNNVANDLTANKAYFASGKVVGDVFNPSSMSDYTSCYCAKISVVSGEEYLIKGNGNAYALKTYIVTDSSNKITRLTESSRTDITLSISGDEKYLYVNLMNYNQSTDGLWKIIKTTLKEKIAENAEGDIVIENISFNEYIRLNTSYNMSGISVGATFSNAITTISGNATIQIPNVSSGKKYLIKGIGSAYAYKLYMFLDENSKVVGFSNDDINSRKDGLIITAPDNACCLIINLTSYDETKDGVWLQQVSKLESVVDCVHKPLKNKKIVCFGDSITEFNMPYGSNYPEILKYTSGATEVFNIGIGGTMIKKRKELVESPTTSDDAYASVDIVSLIEAIYNENFDYQDAGSLWINNNLGNGVPTKKINLLKTIDFDEIDIVIFFAGTNDWNNGLNLGETNSFNDLTTLGAINNCISLLLSKYPKIKIFWFTPIVRWIANNLSQRTDENWAGNKENSEGKTLIDYVYAIKNEVCNQSMPVCDLYHDLGWNKYNFKEFFYDTDGTHPYKGFYEIAYKILSFILANKNFI